jgi:Uma2 family endonuclease
MAQAQPSQQRISPEEYLAGETTSDVRHEFVDGIVFAMAGASERHNEILLNLATLLRPLTPEGCRLFVSDMKLKVEVASDVRFYYPDLFISCGPRDPTSHVRSDATMIIEVLSPSAERHDRYEKLTAYKTLPSLLEYVLVDQSMPSIEVYRRPENWVREGYGLHDNIRLISIPTTVPAAAIFRDIFP